MRTRRLWRGLLFLLAVTALAGSGVSLAHAATPTPTPAPVTGEMPPQTWSEPVSVADTSMLIAAASSTGLAEYVDCVNQVQREAAISGQTNWTFESCQPRDVANCGKGMCHGPVSDAPGVVTYTLYQISNDTLHNDVIPACGGTADIGACVAQFGCEAVPGGNGMPFILCPFQAVEAGTLDVDMAAWRARFAAPAPDAGTSVVIPLTTEGDVTMADLATDTSGAATRTPLSEIRLFGDPVTEAVRLATTVGATVVFAVLVFIPTELINSTLDENADTIASWIPGRKRRTQRRATGSESRDAARNWWHKIPEWLKGIPVVAVAAIITGFAIPDFGFNAMSLRVVLSTFVVLMLINYVGTVLVWMALRKSSEVPLPRIRVHYFYLILLAVSVVLTRTLSLQPALVFGIVLAMEAQHVFSSVANERATHRSLGRFEFVSFVVIVVFGLLGWLGYNLSAAWTAGGAGGLVVAVQELLGSLTIETLTTLPLVMLPLKFMPGRMVFRWNKIVWGVSYVVVLALFLFVLVPLPTAWSTISVPFWTWASVLGIYVVGALIFWGAFVIGNRLAKKRKRLKTHE